MGQAIIIKGADFSANAVEQVFNKVTSLIYDSDAAGDFETYEGSPFPLDKYYGLYYNNGRFPLQSHYGNSLTTGSIPVGGFKQFKVHSKFSLVSVGVVAIGFADANNQIIGYYATSNDDLSNPMCLGVVPTSDWCDVEGNIPDGTAYIGVGCYLFTTSTEYEDFELTLY